jgi:hypothetical protein
MDVSVTILTRSKGHLEMMKFLEKQKGHRLKPVTPRRPKKVQPISLYMNQQKDNIK